MNQLALGLVLKREGMDLTASKNSAWISESLEELRSFARSYPEFTMEQFRHVRSHMKLPEPTSPKTWGAFTHAAVKAGIIVWTGRYMNALSSKTHAHPVKVWRAA
jgi:hypothetical protein